MKFTIIPFKAGLILNDPLFAVNISRKNIDVPDVKSRIIDIQKITGSNSDPEIYYDLGVLYHSISDFEKSLFYFNKYLQINSGFFQDTSNKKLYQTTGDIFFTLSKTVSGELKKNYLEKSLYYFSKALELDKGNSILLERIGDCLLYLSRPDESIIYYKKIHELDHKNFAIIFKLQAADFQNFYNDFNSDRSKINYKDYQFNYLESATDKAQKDLIDSITIQKQIYFLRLILYDYNYQIVKNGFINNSDREKFITDVYHIFENINKTLINKNDLRYINSIISLLKKNFKKSLSELKILLNSNDPVYRFIEQEILNIYIITPQSTAGGVKYISDSIALNPSYEKYLSLARIEFNNGNLDKSEELCIQAVKSEKNCAECYTSLSVIYAHKRNYFAADHMIKKGNSLLSDRSQSNELRNIIKVNEAAIALLKNEKERAYILLRSVLYLDDNENGLLLYNRYFNKK